MRLAIGFPLLGVVVLGVLSLATSSSSDDSNRSSTGKVSMVALLANPDRYDGKEVETEGVAFVQREADALYLSMEDAEHSMLLNGVRLVFHGSGVGEKEKSALHLKRVFVAGTFEGPSQGEPRGTLHSITYIFATEDVVNE